MIASVICSVLSVISVNMPTEGNYEADVWEFSQLSTKLKILETPLFCDKKKHLVCLAISSLFEFTLVSRKKLSRFSILKFLFLRASFQLL